MKHFVFSFFIGLLFITGCGDNNSSVTTEATYDASTFVVFDTDTGNVPYPNNIFFAGSEDGTLNLPYNPEASNAAVIQALNTLDGFSTSSPISIGFKGKDINTSTLRGNLRVFAFNTNTGKTKELTYESEFFPTVSEDKIVILPTKPLASNQNYIVLLTKGIKDTSNQSIAPDVVSQMFLQETPLVDENGTNHTVLDLESALKLEAIRQRTQQLIYLLTQQAGVARDNIVSAWSFKTQTIGNVAQAFFDANASATMQIKDSNYTAKQMIEATGADVSSMKGNAEVYVGVLSNVPYYLANATQPHDTAPLTKSFVFEANSSLPQVEANLTIPVLASIPKDMEMPDNGWPVVIFQHGITQNRTNLLAICEAFASVGYAAVAIDLPLHGIDDNTSALYMGRYERTFNLDLINNETQAAGPDGIIDPSGTHYINLKSLLTSRDNMRQTTSDLIALKNSFGAIVALDGTKFDTSQVAFVGHSLGTMAPFGFFAHANLESVTLAMPGGGIAELLNNSATFGPILEAGLAQAGVIKGTDAYNAFILATQTVLDDADPINYALEVGQKQKIFAIEVVGGNGNLSDQVIPNNVATAPLAGTDPLVNYLGALTLQGNTGDYIAPNKTARYTVGNHSSILDPSASLDATISMQTLTAGFVSLKGADISIPNADILNTEY